MNILALVSGIEPGYGWDQSVIKGDSDRLSLVLLFPPYTVTCSDMPQFYCTHYRIKVIHINCEMLNRVIKIRNRASVAFVVEECLKRLKGTGLWLYYHKGSLDMTFIDYLTTQMYSGLV